jgi:hypothetical protein
VAEIENRILLSHEIKRCDKVDFPAPEGEDKINKSPRLCITAPVFKL